MISLSTPITIISPHRDDAALSLCLAMLDWLREGREVVVVNCFTRSDYAGLGEAKGKGADVVSAVREAEDAAVLASLPGLKMIDLDFLDSPLRRPGGKNIGMELQEIAEAETVTRLAEAISQTGMHGLVLVPLCAGPHWDHVIAVEAVKAAMGQETDRIGFYDDLPYVMERGEAVVCKRVAYWSAQLGRTIQPCWLGEPGHVGQKREIIGLYASQFKLDLYDRIARYSQQGERVWL